MIEATIVVQFGEDAEGLAILELDEVKNSYVDSEGETQIYTTFAPGYTPHFLFHYDSSLEIEKIVFSSGEVTRISGPLNGKPLNPPVIRERTQQLQFIRETLASTEAFQTLTYIPNSTKEDDLTKEWFTDPNATNVGTDWLIQAQRRLVRIDDGEKPRIMNLTYDVAFEQYKLIPPEMSLEEGETFPVLVVFYMRNKS